MNIFLSWLREIGIAGLIDIAIMAVLIYGVLVWMKKTKRAAAVLSGILIVTVFYLAARQFNLFLTVAVLQGFFAIIVVALVVIFQEELRYFFERIAQWSRGTISNRKESTGPRESVDILVRTLGDLARDRIGALVVIRGKDLLIRHVEGGEELKGRISEAVLKSIFDPNSEGHDGAVIIDQDRIDSFACHLPLSKNRETLRHFGTRHAAALGLSELTDALCLVVSEERGIISVARHGNLHRSENLSALTDIIESFYSEISARQERRSWRDLVRKNSREKVLAAGLAMALWFVLVHESTTTFKTFSVPVEYEESPAGLTLVSVNPREVKITLSGSRKEFYFLNSSDIKLVLSPSVLESGRRAVEISRSDLSFPGDFELQRVEPRRVVVSVKEK